MNEAVPVWVNPFDVLCEVPGSGASQREHFLRIIDPKGQMSLQSVTESARSLSQEAREPPVIPHDGTGLVDELIHPLRSAKICFLLNQYLATIALCGMGTEALALLLYRVTALKLKGKPIGPKDETALFGRPFEKISQERRIRILLAFSAIDQDTSCWLHDVNHWRNKYVHLNFKAGSSAADDAKRVYVTCIKILNYVLAVEVRDGHVLMRPSLLAHIRSRSGVRPSGTS